MPYSAPDGVSKLNLSAPSTPQNNTPIPTAPSSRPSTPSNFNSLKRTSTNLTSMKMTTFGGPSVGISDLDTESELKPVSSPLQHSENKNDGGDSTEIDESKVKKNTNRKFYLFQDEDEIITNSDEDISTLKPRFLAQQELLKNMDTTPSDKSSHSQQTTAKEPLKVDTAPLKSLSMYQSHTPSSNSPLIRSNSGKRKGTSLGRISKISLNLTEILKFPKESTHAYSYAYLSPNSLAVRLSILKRSLEILIDRPDLMNDHSHGTGQQGVNLDIESIIDHVRYEETQAQSQHKPSSLELPASALKSTKKFGYSTNASSAALSALFESGPASSPVLAPTQEIPLPLSESILQSTLNSASNPLTTVGLKTLLKIINSTTSEDQEEPTTNKSTSLPSPSSNQKEFAANLLELSLAPALIDKSRSHELDEESELKIKLLYALATPFYEPIAQTPLLSLNQANASTIALSSLASPSVAPSNPQPSSQFNQQHQQRHPNERIFHTVSQKNTSPQAVFTCTYTDPWNLKAANDLACLIFGVSRNSLKRLTLLDLVSPDSRDFVLNKLVSNSINYTSANNDMIFSGEIIAIAKPGNKLTWASLWAKRKGHLIICMFDQVPCDSIDVTIDLNDYNISNVKQISDASGLFDDVSQPESITELIHGLDKLVEVKRKENSNVPGTLWDSQAINQKRYFTIKKKEIKDFNIPCAVTSKVIDEVEGKVKLKIHSLPYIAGVFIISSKDYKILSLNESISKNLFGFKESDLTGQSISKIIPNFVKIFKLILAKFSNLSVKPGLVLPEHFFRQMDSLLAYGDESKFLTSIGLNGAHADGTTVKIDVQLRCSNSETLILWVTHSRTVYGKALEKRKKANSGNKVRFKDSKGEREPSGSITRTSSSSSVYDHGIPSQLSMFKEEDVTSVCRTSSSKNSATTSSSTSATAESSSFSTEDSTSSSTLSSKLNVDEIASEGDTPEFTEDNYRPLDRTLDVDELLKIENETIERTRSFSKKYPREIGLMRREKSIKEFKILKKMGQGAYGRVVLCENIEDPNYRVVIKLIIKERILVDTWVRDRKLGTIPSEIQIMATLNANPHPNIMRLIDFFEDDEYYYIETPPHGNPIPAIDLFDLIELKKNMTEYECKSIIKQCVNALNHLHNNGIVHRDIKDENLIVDNKGVLKLIDFGSAAYINQGPFDVFVGTLDYAAPEVLNGAPYEGKPQDVWSLGILIYTLIYKENPFYNVDEIMEGELRLPFVTSEGCVNLIRKILVRDIKKRPTMSEIVEDPWLNEY